MCFSGPVSFLAGAGLGAVGVATLAKNKRAEEVPLAAIPLLLGVQQVTEGVVWASFASPILNATATYLYIFFSHVLWPIYVPIAVAYAEPDPIRKKLIRLCSFAGTFVGAFLLYLILTQPVASHVAGESIQYKFAHIPFPGAVLFLYLVAICGSCFLSSHGLIRLLGAALFVAFAVAYWFYYAAFFSVWCFFAAALSIIIFAHVGRRSSMPASQARP